MRLFDWETRLTAYLTYVIDLGNVPGAQIDKVIIDDEEVEFEPAPQSILQGGPVPTDRPAWWYALQGIDPANPNAPTAARPQITPGQPVKGDKYKDKIWLRYRDGTQTAADPYLLQTYGPGTPWAAKSKRPWTDDMVGIGSCHAILTFRHSPKTFKSGLPRYRFVMRGTPLYDPRRDSSAGGSGPQRWDNPTTWATSTNGIVLAYNVLRGIPVAGGPLWGYGVSADALPHAVWTTSMNAADEDVDGKPRWQAAWEVSVAEEPASVLDEVLKVCCAKVAESAGRWLIRVGPPAAPVMFVTDDELILDDDATATPFPGLEATWNGIHATYPEPGQLWRPKDAPPRYNAAWEAADQGRRLVAQLNMPACPWADQVQRVMRAYIEEERRFRRHTFSLPPEAEALEPLDVIAWSSAEQGYDVKLFEVQEVGEAPDTLRITVSVVEVDPADYDWRPDFRLPSTISSVVRPTPEPIVAQYFTAEGIALRDEAGRARRPAARLRWGGWSLDGITAVEWELRRAGQNEVARGMVGDPEEGEAIIDAGVIPLTWYEARIRFVAPGRDVVWTEWKNFQTPDARIVLEDLQDDIRTWLTTMEAWIDGDLPGQIDTLAQQVADEVAAAEEIRVHDARDAAVRWRQTRDEVRQLTAQAVELASAAHAARADIRQAIASEVGDIRASYESVITTMADSSFGAVLRLQTLEALAGQLSSRIRTLDQTMVDSNTALALLITQMSVGNITQFDQAAIWHFDDDAEGWTGAPANPAWITGGQLRPAVGGYVLSPTDLAVTAGRYSQVRARVLRTGSPTWTGWFWWRGPGQSWDSARRVAVAAPVWSGSEGLLTITPGWTGTIDQVRLELASNTATAFVDADWIAIGRPAPGASSAELSDLRKIVSDTTSAMAADIDQLRVALNSATGKVSGLVDAVSGLTTRVETTEDGLKATGEALTALQGRVDDPARGLTALAEAIDRVEVEAADGDGSQVVQSNAIRAMRSQLRALTVEALEAATRDHIADQRGRDLVAEASQSLNTRVDVTDDSVRIVADAVTRLQAAIPGLATATALQLLKTEVTAQGGELSAMSASITSLDSALGGKASTKALQSLTTRVDETEAGIKSQSNSLTQLSSSLGQTDQAVGEAQAAAQAASSLAGSKGKVIVQSGAPAVADRQAQNLWIDTTGGANTPKRWTGSAWAAVTDKAATDAAAAAADALQKTGANARALQSLTTRVADTESGVKSVGDSLTALDSTVGNFSAGGRLRITTEATAAGAQATFGIRINASAAEGNTREAALYMDAVAGGTSRAAFLADRFALVSTANGVRQVPFVSVGGKVYIDSAIIRDLSIQTGHMADGAFSTFWSVNAPSVTLTVSYAARLTILTNVRVAGISNGYTANYRITRNGAVVDSGNYSLSPYTWRLSNAVTIDVGAGTYTIGQEYDGNSADYSQFRLTVLGLYK